MTNYEIKELLANDELKPSHIAEMTAQQINEHWGAIKDIIQGVKDNAS